MSKWNFQGNPWSETIILCNILYLNKILISCKYLVTFILMVLMIMTEFYQIQKFYGQILASLHVLFFYRKSLFNIVLKQNLCNYQLIFKIFVAHFRTNCASNFAKKQFAFTNCILLNVSFTKQILLIPKPFFVFWMLKEDKVTDFWRCFFALTY